jgi:hypothetical protein
MDLSFFDFIVLEMNFLIISTREIMNIPKEFVSFFPIFLNSLLLGIEFLSENF